MRRRQLSPPQVLAISILGLAVAGGLLLALPAAAAPGRHVSPLDAFFTSTSAVCVTGLIVIDTPKDLSPFGQTILLLLIQVGGLGYMTITALVALALGKRISLEERLSLQETLNAYSSEGLLRFAGIVALMTLLFELAGTALLSIRWMPQFGLRQGGFLALFHAVSAFNNAGFSLFSDNLMGYRSDLLVNLTITGLIIAGGLGFFVLADLRRGRRWGRLSLHTRFVLVVTAMLIAGGTAGFYLFERANPQTLGGLGTGDAVLASYFHSVSARTAGFNTVNLGAAAPATLFLLITLMFIGASPGGTGGGVKTTTFGITMASLWATVHGQADTVIFKRRVAPAIVARAFLISLIAFLALNVVAIAILVTEGGALDRVLFETTSAFGTVGLSTGDASGILSMAGGFSPVGKLLIMLMMFIGRAGPLTLAVAVAGRRPQQRIRYPEGKLIIG
ncbi:MAG: TrkH family potassium uptake protein [Vicinamibacterales bacterium]